MELSLTLFPFVILAIVLVLANLEQYSQAFRWITYLTLTGLNFLHIMAGLILMLVNDQTATVLTLQPEALVAYQLYGRALVLTGIVAFIPFIPPVRTLIARFISIDPISVVHTTALVFAVYLLGQGFGQQPLLSNPNVVDDLGIQMSSGLVWAQALGMIIVTLPGVGALIRRNWRETLERLAIKLPTLRHLGIAIVGTAGLMLLQAAIVFLWELWDPTSFQQIEDANNLLLGDLQGLGAALTIGLAAAIGEELVFRGALQPRFGLLLTAILFTILHSQYSMSPATLLIFVIALFLGLLRKYTSLTVAILVHFGFNFLGVLLGS